jgi:hypothetical protein
MLGAGVLRRFEGKKGCHSCGWLGVAEVQQVRSMYVVRKEVKSVDESRVGI